MTRCVGDLVTIFLLIIRRKLNLTRFKNLLVARNIAVQGHQLDFNRRFLVQRSIHKVIVEVAHLLGKSFKESISASDSGEGWRNVLASP
jgi:hypothetical protein